jgi:hypothetical protein
MHKSVSSFPVKKKNKFERAENIPFKPENWSNNLFSFRNSIHKIIIIIDFFPFPAALVEFRSWKMTHSVLIQQ